MPVPSSMISTCFPLTQFFIPVQAFIHSFIHSADIFISLGGQDRYMWNINVRGQEIVEHQTEGKCHTHIKLTCFPLAKFNPIPLVHCLQKLQKHQDQFQSLTFHQS